MQKAPNHIFYLLSGLIILSFFSCKPEEEVITFDVSAKLSFSSDSVTFDTLFTSVGSIGKRLYVYNKNKNAVKINVRLAGGESSPYQIVVNGHIGTNFDGFEIYGKDSLLILINATINPLNRDLPFLVSDSILFEVNNNKQDVKLVSWGQDANFIKKGNIAVNTTWNGSRPYVLLDTITVDSAITLTIDKNAKLYFNSKAAIVVKGTLLAEGTPEEKITFTSVRQDGKYKNSRGQWAGLFFLPGSKNSRLDHTSIRNSIYGVYIDNPDNDTLPDLVLSNSYIENISKSGVFSIYSDILGYNLVVDNCTRHLLEHTGGGSYIYKHCTFANVMSIYSGNYEDYGEALFFSDVYKEGEKEIKNKIYFSLTNCIIWGDNFDEVSVSENTNTIGSFNNNIIKTQLPSILSKSIPVKDFKFKNISQYNFRLDTLSPAKDKGIVTDILKDIEGKGRDDKPDLGAYEFN